MTARIGLILLAAAALDLALLTERGGSTGSRAAIVCKLATSGATTVGQVTSVPSSVSQVDTASAYTGKALRNANTVCTSSSGQVKYTLTKLKTTYCNSGTPPHASKVQLYPPSGEIATWVSGWSWCHATGKANATYSSTGKAKLKTTDPLFGVFIGKDSSTTAKVSLGFLDVSGSEGKRSVIVGPAQQVTVPAGGEPGAVVPIALTDGDRATITDLQVLVPPPSFDRPSAGGSKVLARIYSRGSIRIGFDAHRAPDSRVTAFVKRYFADLAENWKLKLALLNVSGSSAPEALASGKIDVEVTPVTPPASLDAFPFFADAKGLLWRIELILDTDWNAGLRSYVTATLTTGRYGTSYLAVFGTQPTYEPLRPLLFP